MTSKETENMKTEFCRLLNKIGAIEFGIFRLTSGKISPYYIDLRIVPSFPDAFRKICDLYIKLVDTKVGRENFERIAGIPTAGISFASVIAYHFKKPFLYVRKEEKLHGRQRKIEGILMPGDRVLLLDDLITTGKSLINAAKAIRAEGGIVENAIVLLDREEGGKENLEKEGIKLHALMKASEAATKLYEIGAIDEEQYRTIIKQIRKS
ncbi:orotate phosphoribosyltransferase [Candidatus Bathyarchaeota archaeon]|nr:MAG: orotate phosphoribosyltransferase [Candidatus Bathyarchaeota archaeon]